MKAFFVIFLIFITQRVTFGSPQRDGGRIVGGVVIPLNKAPYQASLVLRNSYHFCGGSIISKDFILTACHCTLYYKVTDISVRVGSAEIMKGGVVHQLAAIFNNPRFDPYFYDYDFAILKLATPIVLGPNKAAVRLPKLNEAIAAGTATLVTGWGLTKSADSNQFLRGVVVPTYDHATCDEIYIYDGGVTSRMVCAGSLGKDSCNGDSGGPMVRTSDSVLIGIVSFGMDCADQRYPGVYSRVTSERAWIKEISGV